MIRPSGTLRVLVWLTIAALAQITFAASFSVTLDRPSVTVGEAATLSLRFEGGQPDAMPTLPSLRGLQIVSQGSSSQMTVVNGRFSSAVHYNFALVPNAPGEYVIPPLTVKVDGQTLTSEPVKLVATKPGSSAGGAGADPLAFLKIQTSKTNVYVGEVFTLELQAFFHQGIANSAELAQSFDDYTGNPLKSEGVSVLKTAHLQQRRAQTGGSVYRVATIVVAATAIKPGPLVMESIDANLTLHLPTGQRSFFGGQQLRAQQVVLTADPFSMVVESLPAGAPGTFNGAIGQFELNAIASPTNVAAGDPITLKVYLSGLGTIQGLQLPEQNWKGFKLYPPTSKVESLDPVGVQGTNEIEQVISPESTEIREIPPIVFSYFDPEAKSFKTLQHAAVPITVRPGGALPTPQVASFTPRDEQTQSRDIVHIKPRLGVLSSARPMLLVRPWFLALQAIPALTLLAAWAWRKRQDNLSSNPKLRRRIATDKLIQEQVVALRSCASRGQAQQVFAGIFRLLQERLGERLDLPASGITEAVVDEHLRPRNVPKEILTEVEALFQECNLARYAPAAPPQQLNALVSRLESTLNQLEAVLP